MAQAVPSRALQSPILSWTRSSPGAGSRAQGAGKLSLTLNLACFPPAGTSGIGGHRVPSWRGLPGTWGGLTARLALGTPPGPGVPGALRWAGFLPLAWAGGLGLLPSAWRADRKSQRPAWGWGGAFAGDSGRPWPIPCWLRTVPHLPPAGRGSVASGQRAAGVRPGAADLLAAVSASARGCVQARPCWVGRGLSCHQGLLADSLWSPGRGDFDQ